MSSMDKDAAQIAFNMIHHADHCHPDEIEEFYTEWTVNNKYDEHVIPLNKGAAACADALNRHVKDNKDITILDVAAGTGIVGSELKKQGFQIIDALDPVGAMLEVAKQKGIYRNYYKEYFDGNVKCLETDSYDALTTQGAFVQGHLKCEALQEMARCTKSGGVIVFTIRDEILHNVEEYKDRLEPEMKRLEKEGKWEMIERSLIPGYWDNKEGILFVFRAKSSN